MKIENPEQLETLVKLCRKLGVEGIEVDGIKLSLKETPKRTRKPKASSSEIDTNELTDEQLLFWSAEPIVGDNG